MESKANFAVIGVFVLISLFFMVAVIAYFSGRQFDATYDEYLVVYVTPPRGIQVGSEVRYKEINVGEVTETALSEDASRVFVHIRIKDSTPIFKGTFGQNEPLGLTGLSYIQLSKGPSDEPIDRTGLQRGEFARIEGRASQFDELLGGSESVIDNVNVALANAINVLSPEAANDLHGILANINTITAAIAGSDLSEERIEKFMGAIEQAAIDVSIASLAIETTMKDASALMQGEEIKGLLAQADKTLVAGQATLKEYQVLAQHGTALSDEAMRTVEQFTATGLQDLSSSMADLKTLIESLNRVSEGIERSPLQFIVGQDKEITELPQ